ncbi:MAG: hypothetical protein R3C68_13285 [Myxococcota bacterium]
MELRRELLLTIGVLVLLNVIFSFGAIGLFARMGPAIDRIIQENIISIVAAEEILAEFAESRSAGLSPTATARVQQALSNAKRNVTEEEERPALAAIERNLPEAILGELNARAQVVTFARQLIRINREAMRGVDSEARRLGNAGAWAAVFVGFSSFLLSIFVVARLQKRFVQPLVDLHQVLEGVHQGNRLRRCRATDAPHEVIQVTQSVNRLLDERLKYSHVPTTDRAG